MNAENVYVFIYTQKRQFLNIFDQLFFLMASLRRGFFQIECLMRGRTGTLSNRQFAARCEM